MRRRDLLKLLLLLTPCASLSQPGQKKIGALIGAPSDPESVLRLAALKDSLARLGWTDEKNVSLFLASREVEASPIEMQVEELLRLGPDVIVANGTYALALMKRTKRVPIVFTNLIDPLASGLIDPADTQRNITGFSNFELSIGGKWLQLLRELVPSLTQVIVFHDPESVPHTMIFQNLEAVASTLNIAIIRSSNHDLSNKDPFGVRDMNGTGLITLPSVYAFMQRERILALASQHRLPSMFAADYFVRGGGLMSYSVDPILQYRQVGDYLDKILRGASPGSLPIQMPVRYKLSINMKVASRIGLTIDPQVLSRADEVIE